MRDVTGVRLRRDGAVVLTARDVRDLADMKAADFRDSEALVHSSGAYVGISPDGEVCLCRGPCWMDDGVWLAAVDAAATSALRGSVLGADSLSMGLIR